MQTFSNIMGLIFVFMLIGIPIAVCLLHGDALLVYFFIWFIVGVFGSVTNQEYDETYW